MIPPALARPRGLLVVASLCFITIALGALLVGVLPADATVREALLSVASPPMVAVMRVVNAMGDWRGLLPGLLLLYVVFPRARQQWWLWPALLIAAPVAESAVKLLVGRSRPFEVSMGFPSGHATAAAAFFGAVIFLAGSWPPAARAWARAAAAAGIVLVGMARVILGAHWPSDSVGGIALGLALAAAAAVIACRPPASRADPPADHARVRPM